MKMKKVISVYNLKGGVGKSTLSILTATYLQKKGFNIILIDSDIQQNSTTEYIKFSGLNIDCYSISEKLTQADLDGLDADFIIIDGTPRTDKYVENILNLSDIILIPIQPTQLSLSSLLQPAHLKMLKNLAQKVKIVINGTTPYNGKDVQEIKKVIEDIGLNIHGTMGIRKAYILDYSKPFFAQKNNKAHNELGYLIDTLIQ
ncbi:chromosome partitioning protein [Actinobacillus delphinicola]|uniref:ParA family protein n=1 Tax=Actinobacillus delphinicola TaxID=51161 RepID=UPI002441A07D|nr:ParA family protein [Actinobacillus delphinicola]MDG6896481.1 chromosome partitioning protein [Actinobacillus delphinicola]